MAASVPDRNIAVLTTAVLTGGAFALHGLSVAPWELLVVRQAPLAAFASWAAVPCVLGATAVLIGGVRLKTRRSHPFSAPLCHLMALLVALGSVAVMALLFSPARFSPDHWPPQLPLVAVTAGGGLALCSLFWQGFVQHRLGNTWHPLMRVGMVAALGTAIWVPFAVGSAPAVEATVVIVDIAVIALAAAVIWELGVSVRLLGALVAVSGAAAVFVHYPAFL